MTARLASIGTAVPERCITQQDAEDVAARLTEANGRERAIRAIYQRSGVGSRGSVVLDADGSCSFYENGSGRVPSTRERLDRFLPAAAALASDACASALSTAEMDAASITHLITVSCTGFAAPGVEHALIASLGLPESVSRTNIGFMGCHGAVNALAVAKAFAESTPGARVLICCVELSTLHFQFADDPAMSVANALFADGAAAAVVTADEAGRAPCLLATESTVIPDSAECMAWRVGDHGFEMGLSSRVPSVLADAVRPWVDGVLEKHGLAREGIRSWAIHPGGPRVLSTVRGALDLGEGACDASRGVLREHGNMSSATVLFITDRLMRQSDGLPLMGLAFGPGLSGEAFLLA